METVGAPVGASAANRRVWRGRNTQRNCVLQQIKLFPLFTSVNKLSPLSTPYNTVCLKEEKAAADQQKQLFFLLD